MADFEGNPFADPEGVNPFADPAVTEATSANQDVTTTEDYNPFAEEGKQEPEPPRIPPPPTKSQVKTKERTKDKSKDKSKGKQKPSAPERPPDSEPAIMLPDDPPPSYTPGPSAFADPNDEELKKREEEIARREEALHQRERNIERLGTVDRPNNFPPFPKFCPTPFKPCFYINIKVEVPPSEQWKMYFTLAMLIYTWAALTLNLVIAIIGAAGSTGHPLTNEYLTTMGVSILYFVLFLPGSLCCWFLPLYRAYRKDSSLSFMWFFFVMLFQILSYLVNMIGPPNLGSCGIVNGARFIQLAMGVGNQTAVQAIGALFIIMGGLWGLGLPMSIVLIILVHRYYRSSGKTIDQAVEEGVSGAAKNKHVRSAVKQGVSTGVKTAFQE